MITTELPSGMRESTRSAAAGTRTQPWVTAWPNTAGSGLPCRATVPGPPPKLLIAAATGAPAWTQTRHACRRTCGSPAVGRGESTGGAPAWAAPHPQDRQQQGAEEDRNTDDQHIN